jgi:cysteine synthase A
MKIANSIIDIIGNTPLLSANNFSKHYNITAKILVKLECMNPAGSIKDRAALFMLKDAEEKGLIKDGATIIEPTSGNTGIGLASIGASKGYKVILTMPDTMSVERINLLKAYGATVVLTEGKQGMKGAIEKAREIKEQTENSIILGQFDNPANIDAHYKTTGVELWNDTDGKIDIFVATVGTGGTFSGCAKYLKEKNDQIEVVAVEPNNSPMIKTGVSGPHKIQGIGANFVPETLNRNIIDEIITVSDSDAYEFSKKLVECEGILTGISSGAALCAATILAKSEENKGKKIVVLLPDTGERYLSTPNFI